MSMSRETRQIVVAHLTTLNMTPQQIADELGVSRETVRRDLNNQPASAEPEPAPDEAPDVAARVAGLLLPDGHQLRQDLNLLTATFRGKPEDVARFAIHQLAQLLRARMRARLAATPAGRSL